jgi:hypothetical protein
MVPTDQKIGMAELAHAVTVEAAARFAGMTDAAAKLQCNYEIAV